LDKNKKLTAISIGLASGFLGGLLGIGGAFIVIPVMISVLNIEQHKAHATSLAIMIFMAMAASLIYVFSGQTDVRMAIPLFIGSCFGVYAGARIMHRIPSRVLSLLFGLFIVCISLKMIYPGNVMFQGKTLNPWLLQLFLIFLGIFTGLLSGILGVGGAIVSVPGLVFLTGVTQQMAQGITLLNMIPTALIGVLTHWRQGYIEISVIPWIAPASVIASIYGAYWANIVSSAFLKSIFSIILLLLGSRIVILNAKKLRHFKGDVDKERKGKRTGS